MIPPSLRDCIRKGSKIGAPERREKDRPGAL